MGSVRHTAAVQNHADLGSWGVVAAFLVGGSACALMLLDLVAVRMTAGDRPEPSILRPLRTLFSVFAIGFAIFGTVLIIDVGHSGAKATWENTPIVQPSGDRD